MTYACDTCQDRTVVGEFHVPDDRRRDPFRRLEEAVSKAKVTPETITDEMIRELHTWASTNTPDDRYSIACNLALQSTRGTALWRAARVRCVEIWNAHEVKP